MTRWHLTTLTLMAVALGMALATLAQIGAIP